MQQRRKPDVSLPARLAPGTGRPRAVPNRLDRTVGVILLGSNRIAYIKVLLEEIRTLSSEDSSGTRGRFDPVQTTPQEP